MLSTFFTLEDTFVLLGDLGLVLDPAPPFGGRRWFWKATPGGSLELVSSGTGCARDFP